MNLSKHLTLKEVTYSATAIRHGINNEPVIGQLEVLKEMASAIFEPCREFCGGPLKVTSGYRGPDLNKRIGGSLSSDHCISDHATAALDLDCDVYKNSTNADLFYYIMDNLPFKQLIWEFGDEDQPNWVHISWSKNMYANKREVLVAKRANGRAVYEYWKKK